MTEITEPFYLKNGYLNFECIFAVFVSIAIWRGIYILIKLLYPDKSLEFCARILCGVHGVVAGFLGINQCFLIDNPFEHPEWKTTYFQSFIMVFSLGYFVHDTIWTVQNQFEDKVMIIHHVYCVFSLWRLLFKGYSGAQVTCTLGCMELTNPLLQARWFLRTLGLYPSVIHKSAETTFFMIFVAVRLILGTYLLWLVVRQPNNEWEFVTMSFVMYMLSWAFLYQMLMYIRRRYVNSN